VKQEHETGIPKDIERERKDDNEVLAQNLDPRSINMASKLQMVDNKKTIPKLKQHQSEM